MPRVSTASAGAAPKTPRSRAKKPVAPPDRLTARKLYWRRVKRAMRPGLWFLGLVSVLVVATELVRSLPAVSAPRLSMHAPSGFGLAALAADAGLRITKVEVVGAPTTDMAALTQAINVQPGEPSLGFSLDAVRARVEALGAVQSATVARELPGTLIVTVKERSAFAIWQTGDSAAPQFVLIDKSGNVIADEDAAAAKRREPWLLLLAGADAPANAQVLMNELQAQPAVLARVAAAQRVDGLRWNLVLKDQTLVKLPESGEADAITQLGALQSTMQLLDRPVEVIDLRMAGRLVVKPYPVAGEGT